MDAAAVRWLTTPEGARALEVAARGLSDATPLPTLVARLRGGELSLDRDRAACALEGAQARTLLAPRHPLGAALYADRAGAEQAAAAAVAAHTAQRFAGATLVADLGCGIGADTLALARHAPVLAVDRDEARLAMTAANVRVARAAGPPPAVGGAPGAPLHPVDLVAADLATWVPPRAVDAVWVDPARRDAAGRRHEPDRWSPPLGRALALATGPGVRRAGVKVAPALDLGLLPAGVEVECVSLDGSLRAVVAWLGAAVTAPRRATVLPPAAERDPGAGPPEAVSLSGDGDGATGGGAIGPPGGWLYDPDPAVVRAGLVQLLGRRLDARRIDARIAYLVSDHATATPFARRYRLLETMPFGERRLGDALAALGAPRVEVGRRGSPVDVNALERRLNARLAGGSPRGGASGAASGGAPLSVLLTRVGGVHTAIVCLRERDDDAGRDRAAADGAAADGAADAADAAAGPSAGASPGASAAP